MTATIERPHGYARYKIDGCRCNTCGFAMSEYNSVRDRGITAGTWKPYIDATPIRNHLADLSRARIGQRRIVQLSGVPASTLKRILYGAPAQGVGPTARMRPETAVKLLAVRPGPLALADGVDIDATGSARRVQALVANGWPQTHLGARIGMSGTNLIQVTKRPQITAGKARRIAALYLLLENADPRAHGVSETSWLRATLLAERHGWAKPAAWDGRDIDSPAALPDFTGACGTVEGFNRHVEHQIPACVPCKTAEAAQNVKRKAVAA